MTDLEGRVDLAWLLAAAMTPAPDPDAAQVWTGLEEGLDTAAWEATRNRAFPASERLPYMLYVPAPSVEEIEAVQRCAELRFIHGQRLAVFPYAGLPCPPPRKDATLEVKRTNKRAWLQPFWDYSLQHRPAFVHSFGEGVGPERVVARNSMLSALHIDDATRQVHLFMVWADNKRDGEWCQPGGHVDLSDRDLSDTARREWDEEVIGHPFATAQHLDPPTTPTIHAVRKRNGVKFPVDTHVFVRVNDAFFKATAAGKAAAARFEGIDSLEAPLFVHSRDHAPPTPEQWRAYHAGIGGAIVEHEYYIWSTVDPATGGLQIDKDAQVPPGCTAQIRDEISSPDYREGLLAFLKAAGH